MANETRTLQILITTGAEDPHRARQGLEAALAALALGAQVSVFLTLRGAFWVRSHTHADCVIPGCEEIPNMLAGLIEAGASVSCCPACASHFAGSCDLGPEGLNGMEYRGLTAMVAETLSGTPTLTY